MSRHRYTVRLSERAVWLVTVDADCPDDAILGAKMHWVARRPRRTPHVRVQARELTDVVIANILEVAS